MNAVATPQRTLFSVEQFHLMAAAGVFAPGARIELIDGELLNMAPIGSRHSGAVNALLRMLTVAFPEQQAVIAVQNPVILGPGSEVYPDLSVLRPRADFYRSAIAAPADVLLLIEVADTTLRFDQRIKLPLYARHGICEVWIVDVEHSCLEISTAPAAEGYRSRQVLGPDRAATLTALPSAALAWGRAVSAQ
jgi:Uma2 family endonuclease